MEVKKEKNRWLMIGAVLALVFFVVIIFRFGFGLSFWLTLFSWLVVICLIFSWRLSLSIIWMVSGVVIVFSLLVSFNIFPGLQHSKISSANTLVSCTSTLADQPTTIPDYKATMFAAGIASSSEPQTDTRTFSLSAIKNKTGGDDIYYRIERTDFGHIPGVKGLIEVCDSNNMGLKYNTTADTMTTGASDTATAVTYYMHGGNYPHGTGDYRIDAYANVSGTWVFVGRMTGITITQ